jgi:hypothetical protein
MSCVPEREARRGEPRHANNDQCIDVVGQADYRDRNSLLSSFAEY